MPITGLLPLLRRTYWISVVATAATAGTVIAVAMAHRGRERWEKQSREVVRMARRAQMLSLDRETGVRGFLLSGDSSALDPDRRAREPLRATLDSLIRATADNPAQHRRAEVYAAAIARWDTTFARPALAQRAQLDASSAIAAFGPGGLAGKVLFDDVRARYSELEEEEEAIYRARSASTLRLQTSSVVVAVAGLIVLAIIQATLRRQLAKQALALMDRQDQLEQQAIELEEQTAELEEQATELETQTEELQTTVRELRRKNEDLDAFSSSVAHDLRSPLRSIDGFSHLLLADYASRLDAGGINALDRIRANTQRMGELIDGLLTLARVSGVEVRPGHVDVSELASAAGEDLRRTLPAGRTVEYTVQPGLTAHGDGRLLRVAVQNLVENAFKFTRRAERARVEVGAKMLDGERTFFVADTGIGFDMRYADNLFGAFERLHDDPAYEGTGIGLATVRRIVERHGGRLWAESAPGRGATFYFTLGS